MIEPKDIDWTGEVRVYTSADRICPACRKPMARTYAVMHRIQGGVRVAMGCGCVRLIGRRECFGTASPALLLALELTV